MFFKNYFNIKGRSSRSEFWYMVIWAILFTIALTGISILVSEMLFNSMNDRILEFIISLIFIFLTIPAFTLSVRRFHDVGWSMTIPIMILIISLIARFFGFFIELSSGFGFTQIEKAVTALSTPNFDYLSGAFGLILSNLYWLLTIAIFIVAIYKSQKGPNKYGPNPKEDFGF
ncbi:DUF805 domain-containing protein [Staphylococcus massiliensis]|uniref:DUF805 domain-containing protein n=1 Tax=Staphylococcus massiliensis TaxID=555791 RepID=UPI001EDE598C|nr:DUF805 domain-containing protein [Staphylococcus massiliensis]